ncbi:hypothetical protein BGZ60DRAFT_393805 [Tricladium varicosporioides]|nr:hypothetical protein BGZ60DRAFT_393805 [Hymenoscyphus varicosporioides]
MADTPPAPSSEPSTPPSSAAEQARIRKERREAKIRAGGSARLNKITGLGGGVQRDPPPQPAAAVAHADPDEIDISQHFYEPKATRRANNASPTPGQQMNDDQLRQMMLGFDPTGTPPPGENANPFAGFPGMAGMPGMEGMGGPDGPGADDPMMKMLQQMMGGMGGIPGEGAGGMPSFPGMPGQPTATAPTDPYAYIWRIIHAVFALGLGLYIAFTTTFTGTLLEREKSGLAHSAGKDSSLSPGSIHFFYIFATAEILLQTSRFFMEKGAIQPGGFLGTIMGFLPPPYKGYLGLAARYFRIWTTVSGDAMTCVFVLGVCAWLRGS